MRQKIVNIVTLAFAAAVPLGTMADMPEVATNGYSVVGLAAHGARQYV